MDVSKGQKDLRNYQLWKANETIKQLTVKINKVGKLREAARINKRANDQMIKEE